MTNPKEETETAARPFTIKGLVVAEPGWYAAVRGRGDFEGAHMQRVACWAVVVDPDGNDRVRACYLPLPDAEAGPYLSVHETDDDDVLGLSEPGKALEDFPFYQDQATDLAKSDEEDRDEGDAKREAPAKLAELTGLTAVLLAKIVRAGSTFGHRVGDFGLVSDFFDLANRGLIYPHAGSIEGVEWIPTSLGREVAKLDEERERA